MDLLLIVTTIIVILSTSLLVYMGSNPNFLKLKAQPKVAEIEQDSPVGWECAQYSQRLLEEKLVDAGAMKAVDMTTCEDPKCVLCEGTRLLVSKEDHRDFRERLQSAKNYSAQALSTVSTPNEQRRAYENCANCEKNEILVDDLFDAVVYKHTPCDAHKGSHEELYNRMMSLVTVPNHTVDPAPYMEDYGSRRECGEWLCG